MHQRTERIWGWIRHHRFWSVVMLIILLVGIGYGMLWTVNFVRFGVRPPTGQNCGSIIHREASPGPEERADATLQVLACFWHAYQSCQPATMSQTYAATDVGYTDTVTLEQRNAHCAIYGQEEAQANTDIKDTIFLCNVLSKKDDALLLSGCDGIANFALVPRRIPSVNDWGDESYRCGTIGGKYAYNVPQRVERCFFSGYKRCLGDAMLYFTQEHGVEVERDFVIDNHCTIVYKTKSYTGMCADVEWRTDGLHFMRCGTDGDIFVPQVLSGSPAPFPL